MCPIDARRNNVLLLAGPWLAKSFFTVGVDDIYQVLICDEILITGVLFFEVIDIDVPPLSLPWIDGLRVTGSQKPMKDI